MTDLKVFLWTYLPSEIKIMFDDSFYDRFEGVYGLTYRETLKACSLIVSMTDLKVCLWTYLP